MWKILQLLRVILNLTSNLKTDFTATSGIFRRGQQQHRVYKIFLWPVPTILNGDSFRVSDSSSFLNNESLRKNELLLMGINDIRKKKKSFKKLFFSWLFSSDGICLHNLLCKTFVVTILRFFLNLALIKLLSSNKIFSVKNYNR